MLELLAALRFILTFASEVRVAEKFWSLTSIACMTLRGSTVCTIFVCCVNDLTIEKATDQYIELSPGRKIHNSPSCNYCHPHHRNDGRGLWILVLRFCLLYIKFVSYWIILGDHLLPWLCQYCYWWWVLRYHPSFWWETFAHEAVYNCGFSSMSTARCGAMPNHAHYDRFPKRINRLINRSIYNGLLVVIHSFGIEKRLMWVFHVGEMSNTSVELTLLSVSITFKVFSMALVYILHAKINLYVGLTMRQQRFLSTENLIVSPIGHNVKLFNALGDFVLALHWYDNNFNSLQ